MALYSGDLAVATTAFEEGLALLEPGRELTVRLDLLLSYSSALALLGDAERATWCHEEFLRITEPAGEFFHRAYALWTFGLFVMQQGDLPRAAELIRAEHPASTRPPRPDGSRVVAWSRWRGRSPLSSTTNEPRHCWVRRTPSGRSWAVPCAPTSTCTPTTRRASQTADEQLGTAGFEAAFAQGAAFSVDDAIAYALGELSPAAAAASSKQDTVLTARELEIAELIAEGLSNRQIATRLTISVRTAETHAQNILTKLGFRSRAQIASWVAQQHPWGHPRRAVASPDGQRDLPRVRFTRG